MFTPLKTTERFDRNIFTGQGTPMIVEPKVGFMTLRFYFAVDTIVGIITGQTHVLVYQNFKRGEWWPVEVLHEGGSYCGWIDENLFLFK